jgi:ribose 5-phosphate isomerase A
MSAEAQKRAVGEAAAALVEDHMTVGLGTGSTAAFLVMALGARVVSEGLSLRCVATSSATETLAVHQGLNLIDLNDAGEIDLTLDGADEVGPGLAVIKGGGGALLREKLVWESSRRCIVIADAAKRVAQLGAFPLPIEVVAFGHVATARRLASALQACGLATEPRLRLKDGEAIRTDGGNLIYDAPCLAIPDPPTLAVTLKRVTGVVEHGLFLGLASEALIGTTAGVERLSPAPSPEPRR